MAFSRPAPQDATQAEMEAGTQTAARTMNPAGVAQAIAALGGSAATIAGYTKPVYGADTSNVWLGPPGMNHTGAPLSPNVIYAVRIFVNATRTFTKMRCAVGVAWSAGSTLRMAITNETESCTPGTLILDTGTIAADSTGFKDFTISQSLSPGWYWLLWSTNGTGGQISAGTATASPNGVFTASATSSGNIQYLSRSLTYAAYGDQTGATWAVTFNSNAMRLLIQ